jgi:hypothetical protein
MKNKKGAVDMAEEKKGMDISTYYARQEMVRFVSIWEETSEKIKNLIETEEPDADTLTSIVKVVDGLKKAVKPTSYMALLLSKQKACEEFLEEKGLSDEFADFTQK